MVAPLAGEQIFTVWFTAGVQACAHADVPLNMIEASVTVIAKSKRAPRRTIWLVLLQARFKVNMGHFPFTDKKLLMDERITGPKRHTWGTARTSDFWLGLTSSQSCWVVSSFFAVSQQSTAIRT